MLPVLRWMMYPFVKAARQCARQVELDERAEEKRRGEAKYRREYEARFGPVPPGCWVDEWGNLFHTVDGKRKCLGRGWQATTTRR